MDCKLKTAVGKASALTEENHVSKRVVALKNETMLKIKKELANFKTNTEIYTLKKKLLQNKVELEGRDKTIERLRNGQGNLKRAHDSECVHLKKKIESESKRAPTNTNTSVYYQNMKLDSLNRQLEDMKTQMQMKSNITAALKKLLTKAEKEASAAVENLKMKKGQLKEQLVEKHVKLQLANKDLEQQLEENATRIKKLEEELNDQKSITSLQRDCLNASDAKVNELEEEIAQKDMQLEESETNITNQRGRVKLLLRQLMNRELDNSDLQRELDKERVHREQMQCYVDPEEVVRLREQIKILEESLHRYMKNAGKSTCKSWRPRRM